MARRGSAKTSGLLVTAGLFIAGVFLSDKVKPMIDKVMGKKSDATGGATK